MFIAQSVRFKFQLREERKSLLAEFLFCRLSIYKYFAPDGAPNSVIIPQTNESLSQAAVIIARGGVIGFRTDTFYGLGADPFNQAAVGKIKELKGREEGKPILVLISDAEQLERLISQKSATFDLLARQFWPGPLTIIGPANPLLPEALTARTKTVGVRLPENDKVRALVRSCGGTLTATSANPSGAPPARTAAEVHGYFGEALDLIIDGGVAKTDQPSTVVDVATPDITLIREGVITWSQIQTSLK
jgi:L-threonylcarbamoyladenylate synthase